MTKEYIVKKSIGNDSGRVFSQKEVGELVRCKDCKYYEKTHLSPSALSTAVNVIGNYCNHWDYGVGIGDYCSYGERKEE